MGHGIIKRRRGYYAALAVPCDVHEQVGQTKFRKTLKTCDWDTAIIRSGPILAKWRRRIAVVRGDKRELRRENT